MACETCNKLKELSKNRKKLVFREDHEYVIAWLDVYRLGMITRSQCVTNLKIFTQVAGADGANDVIDNYFT